MGSTDIASDVASDAASEIGPEVASTSGYDSGSITELVRRERRAAIPVSIEPAFSGSGDDVFRRLDQLNDIGASLSFEQNVDALLERIIVAAKTITGADAGTLYLMEGEGEARQLAFAIVRTASLGVALGGTTGRAIPYSPIPLYLAGQPNHGLVASSVALNGRSVNIANAYKTAEFDFQGPRDFDARTGYHSQSFLAVPLKNHADETIGVLQLINATDPVTGEIGTFTRADQRLAESLASQAAVALTNRRLILQLQHLFESFIKLINTAIDEKSPYTGGHCERVPELTMMIADAVDRTGAGPLAGFTMNDADRYELRIAGLLHDCGKITTPVHVVDKATKLETIFDRIHLVDQRFEVLKRDAEIEALSAKLAIAQQGTISVPDAADWNARIERRLQAQLAQLDRDREFLRRTNIGVEGMSGAEIARVRAIANGYSWRDVNGYWVPFLSIDEIENLTIRSGTLTAEERQIINQHIVSTITMLEALPWPKHLRNVPEYAGGHHERMDGRGYPRGLRGEQMSVQARIMAVADIFEALTARDRPYKRGKMLSEAMTILAKFAANGHIDPDVFDIFLTEGVYLAYAQRYVDPDQIDSVDEEGLRVLARGAARITAS